MATVTATPTPWYKQKTTKLIALGCLTLGFVVLEIAIGYMSGSLALVADAFHALSDFLALGIAFYAVKLAQRKMPELPVVTAEAAATTKDSSRDLKSQEQQIVRHKLHQQLTFGLQRAEVLGALINATFLLSLSFSVLVQAIERFFSIASTGEGTVTNPKLVLIVGVAGFTLNVIGMFMFHEHHGHDHGHGHSRDGNAHDHSGHSHSHGHGHGKDLNAYGVFLHVTGDALGSLAVIASALVNWLCVGDWRYYFDPAISVLFTIIIAITTIPLIIRTAKIMMLATPSSVSMPELKKAILDVEGVLDLHEVHVFELKSGVLVASLHVVIEDNDSRAALLPLRNGDVKGIVWCESPDCPETSSCGTCGEKAKAAAASSGANNGNGGVETPANYDTVALNIRLAMHRFGIHATTIQPEFVKAVPCKDSNNKLTLLYVPVAESFSHAHGHSSSGTHSDHDHDHDHRDHDDTREGSHDHSHSEGAAAPLQPHGRLHHHHSATAQDEDPTDSGLSVLAGFPVPLEPAEGALDALAEVSCLMRCPAIITASSTSVQHVHVPRATSPGGDSNHHRPGSPEHLDAETDCCEVTLACGQDTLCCEPGISERGRLRKLEEAERALAMRKTAVRVESKPRLGRTNGSDTEMI